MKIIYLLSGSYTKKEIPSNVSKIMKKDLKSSFRLGFIPTDFNNFLSNDEHCQRIISWMKDKNITFSHYQVIDNRIKKKNMIEIINDYEVLFLAGGDTLKQIDNINKYKLKKALRGNESIIIGMSAGAINLANKVVIAKDEEDNIPELKIYKGIGLTKINLEPHCDFYNKKHWNDLIEASYITKIICMEDNCSIRIEKNNIEFYGKYCILENGFCKYDNKIIDAIKFIENYRKEGI